MWMWRLYCGYEGGFNFPLPESWVRSEVWWRWGGGSCERSGEIGTRQNWQRKKPWTIMMALCCAVGQEMDGCVA
ncbi:hypothetical protein EX30DRAFT_184898 [Ascodesmis nigricans]|uniref:Uncharacterized protein n=1 Tax=Ascodesmis nigricans TaxID=341454 RepID=A0A4S2N060_9PEZI|nr:hypothetical protein EX30DRAFT_184898 [Ascodesmis nigricans]